MRVQILRAYILLPLYSLLSLLYLTSPIHLSPTENSRLCSLLKYISQPADSPCGQLSITRDRPRKSLTVHNRYHTWTGGPTPPPKIGRPRTILPPADYRCMPARYWLATNCPRCQHRTSSKYRVGQKILTYALYRMVTFPMTLMDPLPGFQGHDISSSRISEKRRILKTKLLLHKRKNT